MNAPWKPALSALMMRLLLAGGIAAAAVSGPEAQAQRLATGQSENLIAISSSFTGARILIFGAIEDIPAGSRKQLDIAVVVRGPERSVVVWRKERIAGIWVNSEALTYKRIPSYYALAASRPLEAFISPAECKRLELAFEALEFVPETRKTLVSHDLAAYRRAVIRNKREAGLFIRAEDGVEFLSETLFKAEFEIPANVPVGAYPVTIHLFGGGRLLDTARSKIEVDQVGIERIIRNFAHRHPLLHGFAAVAIAMGAGWLAAFVFRQT